MINITKADEIIEVENITFTIYSQPGLGKTSLAFTAARPLLIDFDEGSYRAVDRKDVVQIGSWSDIAKITADDVADFDTIVIDTAGKALDCLAADVIASKAGYGFGGALSQQGWGQLGVRFGAFLKLLKGFGKDVVMIAHMDEKADGDGIKERLKIQGGSKDLILTDSDVIARISINNKQRHLVFSPTETSFGKDPANLADMVIPDAASDEFSTCLADTISAVKSGLNQLSAAQIERRSEVEWFKKALAEIFSADEINGLLARAKKAGNDVSKMLVARANHLGFDFDTQQRQYVELPNETPKEEAA